MGSGDLSVPSWVSELGIIGQSDAVLKIFQTIERLSPFDTTVLITGESGTGKELIARAIHTRSKRAEHPFIGVNCGAIPVNLIESELFGHKKGAFTDAVQDKEGLFHEAHNGTMFLDEIGELPLLPQVKLLRVIQERRVRPVGSNETEAVNVRIIAATLRDLESDVERGRFRKDLFYRLNVVTLRMPPLRERRDDIPILVEHFIQKHTERLRLDVRGVDDAALKILTQYAWPGNVRELENCIERSLVLADHSVISPATLPDHICEAALGDEMTYVVSSESLSIKEHTKALEMKLIINALRKTGGNRTKAAKVLDISHRALLYKLKEYELTEIGK